MVSFQPRTSGTVHEFTCQLSRVISFTTLNAFDFDELLRGMTKKSLEIS